MNPKFKLSRPCLKIPWLCVFFTTLTNGQLISGPIPGEDFFALRHMTQSPGTLLPEWHNAYTGQSKILPASHQWFALPIPSGCDNKICSVYFSAPTFREVGCTDANGDECSCQQAGPNILQPAFKGVSPGTVLHLSPEPGYPESSHQHIVLTTAKEKADGPGQALKFAPAPALFIDTGDGGFSPGVMSPVVPLLNCSGDSIHINYYPLMPEPDLPDYMLPLTRGGWFETPPEFMLSLDHCRCSTSIMSQFLSASSGKDFFDPLLLEGVQSHLLYLEREDKLADLSGVFLYREIKYTTTGKIEYQVFNNGQWHKVSLEELTRLRGLWHIEELDRIFGIDTSGSYGYNTPNNSAHKALMESFIREQQQADRRSPEPDASRQKAQTRAVDLQAPVPAETREKILHKRFDAGDDRPDHETVEAALRTIKHNIRGSLSITGDRDTLVTRDDVELLKAFNGSHRESQASHTIRELQRVVRDITLGQEYQNLRRYLSSFNIDRFKARLDRPEHDGSLAPDLEQLARANKLLLDIQQGPGRRWHDSLLSDPEAAGEHFSEVFTRLKAIRALDSPALDTAQLEWMKQQNHAAPRHPSVVIEGAGPVGLISAIKLYMAGANVSVFERRGTDYRREQIIRLDSQWINELRFVLGEKFAELFHPHTGIGQLFSDGSGSIVIRELERMLHERLSELISLEDNHGIETEGNIHLHRFAAFTVQDVLPPDQPGGSYRVLAQYHPNYDLQAGDPDQVENPDGMTPQQQQQIIEADILVCAGGKNSPARDLFFRHAPVTESAEYGVSLWAGSTLKTHTLDTFPAIQGLIQLDDHFQGLFIHHVNEQMNLPHVYSGEAETLATELLAQGPDTPFSSMLHELQNQVVEIRTLENRGIVYLGMEIPTAAKDWFSQLNSAAIQVGLSPLEVRELNRAARESWFQAVADAQGFGKKLNAGMETISHPFTATFPVAQEASTRHSIVIRNREGSELLIVPVGEAATSSHFMSASGATGGFADQRAVEQYLENVIHNPYETEIHRQQMDEHLRGSRGYVLSGGRAFLAPLSVSENAARLKAQSRQEMVRLAEQSAEPDWLRPFIVEQSIARPDQFFVKMEDKLFVIDIRDAGLLEIHQLRDDGKWHRLGSRHTFKEFELRDLSGGG